MFHRSPKSFIKKRSTSTATSVSEEDSTASTKSTTSKASTTITSNISTTITQSTDEETTASVQTTTTKKFSVAVATSSALAISSHTSSHRSSTSTSHLLSSSQSPSASSLLDSASSPISHTVEYAIIAGAAFVVLVLLGLGTCCCLRRKQKESFTPALTTPGNGVGAAAAARRRSKRDTEGSAMWGNSVGGGLGAFGMSAGGKEGEGRDERRRGSWLIPELEEIDEKVDEVKMERSGSFLSKNGGDRKNRSVGEDVKPSKDELFVVTSGTATLNQPSSPFLSLTPTPTSSSPPSSPYTPDSASSSSSHRPLLGLVKNPSPAPSSPPFSPHTVVPIQHSTSLAGSDSGCSTASTFLPPYPRSALTSPNGESKTLLKDTDKSPYVLMDEREEMEMMDLHPVEKKALDLNFDQFRSKPTVRRGSDASTLTALSVETASRDFLGLSSINNLQSNGNGDAESKATGGGTSIYSDLGNDSYVSLGDFPEVPPLNIVKNKGASEVESLISEPSSPASTITVTLNEPLITTASIRRISPPPLTLSTVTLPPNPARFSTLAYQLPAPSVSQTPDYSGSFSLMADSSDSVEPLGGGRQPVQGGYVSRFRSPSGGSGNENQDQNQLIQMREASGGGVSLTPTRGHFHTESISTNSSFVSSSTVTRQGGAYQNHDSLSPRSTSSSGVTASPKDHTFGLEGRGSFGVGVAGKLTNGDQRSNESSTKIAQQGSEDEEVSLGYLSTSNFGNKSNIGRVSGGSSEFLPLGQDARNLDGSYRSATMSLYGMYE